MTERAKIKALLEKWSKVELIDLATTLFLLVELLAKGEKDD